MIRSITLRKPADQAKDAKNAVCLKIKIKHHEIRIKFQLFDDSALIKERNA